MAKTTLIIEDAMGPDGGAGVTIEWNSTDENDEESLANYLTSKFVSEVVSAAGTVQTLPAKLDVEGMN